MKKVALYCGSFDPFTSAHLGVIKQAQHLLAPYHNQSVEKIYVCIGDNDNKQPLFNKEKRVEMVKTALKQHQITNVEVISYQGLTVDLAYRMGSNILIRGIKKDNVLSLQEETTLSMINQELAEIIGFKLETIFIETPKNLNGYVSSSLVKKLCSLGQYITVANLVPANVLQELVINYLKPRFLSLFYSDCQSIAEIHWKELVTAYYDRPYHNLCHIGYMFNLYDKYLSLNNDKSKNANLELAIFAHDLVYNPLCNDNELKSAQQALSWYGIKYCGESDLLNSNGTTYTNSNELIKNLILATKIGTIPTTETETLIKDLDLSILGTYSYKIFNDYIFNIRQEYISYPKEDYINQRVAFLNSLLQSKRIFQTDFFYSRFEKQARENIKKEISGLYCSQN